MQVFRIDAQTKDAFYNYSIQILNCRACQKVAISRDGQDEGEAWNVGNNQCLYSIQDNEFT